MNLDSLAQVEEFSLGQLRAFSGVLAASPASLKLSSPASHALVAKEKDAMIWQKEMNSFGPCKKRALQMRIHMPKYVFL